MTDQHDATARELHAGGRLEKATRAWWSARMKSRIEKIIVRGDGYVRVSWDNGSEIW